MKPLKNNKKNSKSETDSLSVSLPREQKKAEKSTLLGVMVDADFFQAVDAAAKKRGLTRSNFVRAAIAVAVRDSGVEIDDSSATSYRGQQSAPKVQVDASAAGARAVRDAKRAGTPENARYKALVGGGMHPQAALDYLYTKAKAERFAGRALTPEEDAEFLSSASRAYEEIPEEEIIRRAAAGMGEGPPIFPADRTSADEVPQV